MILIDESVRPQFSRRPPTPTAVRNLSIGGSYSRRPPPSRPQFSGFVEVGEEGVFGRRRVQLRLRSGAILEQVWSDEATGYFFFTDWYPVRDDYEIHVVGGNYVNTSFPTLAPFEVTWRGNPQVRSSDSGPAPPWPPDVMEVVPLSTIPIFALEGEDADYSFRAQNGITPVGWSLSGDVPPGLSLNASTGRITGQFETLGAFTFTVTAVDITGQVSSYEVSLEVVDFLPLSSLIHQDSPLHYWPLNDLVGPDLRGEIGGSGVYIGGPKLNQAILYPRGRPSFLAGEDSANAYGQINNPLPGTMQAFSLLCVVKFRNIAGYKGIVSADASGRKWQWRLFGSAIEFVKIAGGVSTVSGGTLAADEVALLGLSVSETGQLRMYKNGTLMSTTSLSAANYGGNTEIQIGYMSGGGGAPANAFMSDAAIFDKVITPERMMEYAIAAQLAP